ncbi:hypothetical protein [Pedobacter sp. SYP-B3415]|uniref:hypothetical protein n=1 Tax=Pedobacter sp. SYP-B3415 TaxID=2496641 RepID=UPI00101BA875|nr:hypothetical protein [Pedobacter sp. SYP-B3415]
MRVIKKYFSQLMLCCFLIVLTAEHASARQRPTSIPFELTAYNNIIIGARLNKKDSVRLMFHTAANAITLTAEAVKKLNSVHFSSETDRISSWGGAGNSSRMSTGNLLEIGKLSWRNQSLWENTNSGQGSDGKCGIDLFTGKILEIDYDRSQLLIHKKTPEYAAQYKLIPLHVENGQLFIDADCFVMGRKIVHRFMLHSGYPGAVLFNDNFARSENLGKKLVITGEKTLRDAFGNAVKTTNATLPEIQIGGLSLFELRAGFFEGSIGRQQVSLIGGDILKRFNLIIDSETGKLYLKAGRRSNESYFSG